jgi:hypothetical protein
MRLASADQTLADAWPAVKLKLERDPLDLVLGSSYQNLQTWKRQKRKKDRPTSCPNAMPLSVP